MVDAPTPPPEVRSRPRDPSSAPAALDLTAPHALPANGRRPGPALDGVLATLLGELGLGGPVRQWRSVIDRGRRYAASTDRFAKIDACHRVDLARRQDLRGEHAVLCRLRGIGGVPEPLRLVDGACWRILLTTRVEGMALTRLAPTWPRLLLVELRLARLVWQLARRGVSHDDLRPENVLVDDGGRVALVDFDQAVIAGRWCCLARALLGVRAGATGEGPANTLWAPLRERVQARLHPRWIRLVKRRRLRQVQAIARAAPPLPPGPDPALRLLIQAWRTAADADASAPGLPVAYYALSWAGVALPGERPWAPRWRCLAGVTEVAGRRVLELGCNMALLSIFLLEEAGAGAALAVDRDRQVLDAAALAAAAFGVSPELRRVDFDADGGWEAELAAFAPDVVYALSILEWVQDQARLLAFLGRFEEVVYEGHDSGRTEIRRLRQAGFAVVDLVATSERGRPILHARKAVRGDPPPG